MPSDIGEAVGDEVRACGGAAPLPQRPAAIGPSVFLSRGTAMHGVIPPDGPNPVPAGAAPGLARSGGSAATLGRARIRTAVLARHAGQRRRATARAAPFPPVALAALAMLPDIAAVVLAGGLLGRTAITAFRPDPGAVLFLALLMPCLAGIAGGYVHPGLFGGRHAPLRALAALGASIALLWGAGMALGEGRALPLGVALLWFGLAAPLLLLGRAASGAALRALHGRVRRRAVLVVGHDGRGQARRLAAALAARPDRSLTLLGTVAETTEGLPPGPDRGARIGDLAELGGLDDLIAMIRRGEVDEAVLALPWSAEARILHLLDLLSECPVDVRLAPEAPAYRGARGWRLGAPEAGGLVLPRLASRPIGGIGGLLKAAEDRVLAVAALAILAVPMALIALAIRLDSPGPALFRQRRTGFNDSDFHVLKFRTMYVEHTDPEARRQVCAGDRRVTRVGALLRRTSLDELPQIFNVLRGEMSIVGPRPHAPGTLAGGRPFQEVVARYAARHRVKPGLTGLAQVRGWRGPTETEEKLVRRVESDLEYIENWSLWLDFAILVRTLLVVARMRNAL